MSGLKLKYISVGKAGGIWAAGETDGTIFRLYGDAGYVGWSPDKDGKADVVAAVDWGEAWCVNKDHEIWHVENALSMDGGKWTKIPTNSGGADARTISVGVADGTVWYAQTDGKLFRREGGAWKQDPTGKATVIAAVSKDEVWCVNQAHELWHMKSGQWTKISTYSGGADAKTISVGADGTVWYAQTDGKLFRREGSGWHADPTGKATVVAAVSKDAVWCVNEKGEAWLLHDGKWTKDIEKGPAEESWVYTVGQSEHLLQIVRAQYHVQDPALVNKIGDEIARLSKLANRDNLAVGQKLTMPPLSYR